MLYVKLYFIINFVCSFFQADDGSESLQYLRAYCYMHCLFLQLLTRHSSLIETAREQLMEFINTPAARHINVQKYITLLDVHDTPIFLEFSKFWYSSIVYYIHWYQLGSTN